MTYSTHETDWAVSARGNFWRRVNGIVLVVGRKKGEDSYWAMRDGVFIDGNFRTKEQAQRAAEAGPHCDSWRW